MDVSIAESRFYVYNERMGIEEDHCHEFKGHRNVSVEELPPWSFIKGRSGDKLHRSRRAVSRTLCGFLNSGEGGTVYMGVTDDGVARGMRIQLYQRDHMIVSLRDLMSRFSPPIHDSMIQVVFVPVLASGESQKKWLDKLHKSDATLGKAANTRAKQHKLRSYEYCWCDVETEAMIDCSDWLPTFVIELSVRKRKITPEVIVPAAVNWPDMKPLKKAEILPVYEDEEGKCYCRGQGGLFQYPAQEVKSNTQVLMSSHYLPIIERLRSQLHQARFILKYTPEPMTDEEFRKKNCSVK
eukprot:scpid61177/ scgid14925/ 